MAEPRFFSLDEANRMLPLVRRIVEDITAQHATLAPLVERYRALTGGARAAEAGRRLKADVDERARRLDALVHELHELGCLFKGAPDGLVDWYSLYAGRAVFLCWRLGEPEIAWWHQVDAGFAGRQPILDSQRSAFRAAPDPALGGVRPDPE